MSDHIDPAAGLVFGVDQRPEILTFLIADIRGYTQYTLQHGDAAAARLTTRFAQIADEIVTPLGGKILELRGDEALAVFPSARRALRAAMALQERFLRAVQADPTLPLRVGFGVDAGEPVRAAGGYRGAALNLASRLCSLAAAGEILVSETIVKLAGRMDGIQFVDRGAVELKGFAENVPIFRAIADVPTAALTPGSAPDAENRRVEQALPIGGFLGSLPNMPLVAREAELDRLLATLEASSAGQGRLVLLSGEPGVGKTRLAQEITLSLRNAGFIVAAGSCFDTRQTVALYPFRDILEMLLDAAPSGLRRQVTDGRSPLAQLIPETGVSHSPDGDQGEEQERLFRALTGFIQAMAKQRPIGLLLDDLHWADQASLDLLEHITRHTRGHSVFIVGTYRDVEVGRQHPLERALRDLTREALVEEIPVRRFDRSGTAALTATTFGYGEISGEFAELLHRHTEGNPFFTHEVLRALVERGDLYQADGRWQRREIEQIEVPRSVRSAIGERLSRLTESAQAILTEASILGQTFGFEDLEAMGGRAEAEVEAALEEAVGAGLIQAAGGDAYGFNHALTQQVLLEDIPPRRKRRLHRAAGEAMEAGKHPERRAAELAFHFLQADDPPRALRYSLLAGEEAERVFAYGEAERLYRQSLALITAEEESGAAELAEADVRGRLGRALKNLGRYDEALSVLRNAERIYQAIGNAAGGVAAAAEIGSIQLVTGAQAEGIETIESLLRDAEPPAEAAAETARLYVSLAHLYMANGETRSSLAAAERAEDLARDTGSARVRAQAQAVRGDALRLLGQEERALEVLQDTVDLVRSIGDVDAEFLALDAIAELLAARGDLLRSEHHRGQAVELVQRTGDLAKLSWELTSLGHLMFCLGRWEEARRHIGSALRTAEALPPSRVTAYALIRLAQCDIGAGEWKVAGDRLEGAVALSQQVASRATELIGHGLLAELDLLRGYPRRALNRLERQTLPEDASAGSRASFQALTAWAHVLLGDGVRAAEASSESVRAARGGRDRIVLVDVLRISGVVDTAAQAWEPAEKAFGEAVQLARGMPFPYAEARALLAWGTMERRRERPDAARRLLERAEAIFNALGARGDADACLGERIPAPSRSP